MGLQGTLQTHAAKFGGVLNGVDYSTWNPEIDPHIARHYGVDTLPREVPQQDRAAATAAAG